MNSSVAKNKDNGVIQIPTLSLFLFGRFILDALWASLFIEQLKFIHLANEV